MAGTIRSLDDRKTLSLAVLLLVLITGWRLSVLFGAPLNLSFDEAQYWLWSQSVAFGYFSKPPMVAWATALTTSLCGEGEGCVRLSSPLAYFGAALFLFALARRLFDLRTAFWTALAFATLPAVALSSMLLTTDPFLLLFWAAALYFFRAALEDDKTVHWVAMGTAIGLGLLSKYAMAMFFVSVILHAAWAAEWRGILRRKGLWLAVGVALVLYAPNLLWNLTHGLASYKHTQANANLGGPLFHPDKGAEFLAAQFAVFGPIFFAALLVLLVRAKTIFADERRRYLAAFMLPLAVMMVSVAFLSRANANWSAPIYVAGTPLVVAVLLSAERAWLVRLSVLLHLAGAMALYNVDGARQALGMPLTAKTDPLKRLRGWSVLGQQLSRVRAQYPSYGLLFDERRTMSSLIYYVKPHPFDALKWNPAALVRDTFEMNHSLRDAPGRDFLYITEKGDVADKALRFAASEQLAILRVSFAPEYSRELKVYLLRDFQGYDGGPSSDGDDEG